MTFSVFAVGVVAAFIIAVVVGLAWFIAVPVLVFLLLVPVAYMLMLKTRPRTGGASGSERIPSSEEASYSPVSDPSHPGGR